MKEEIIKKIESTRVIAVIIIDEVENALPLANALLEGGVDIIELTLRTPAALAAGSRIKNEVPELTLGFGTVITKDQVKAVVDSGADFAVAPGCNPRIIKEAKKNNLSFSPGIMTPTDIEIAVEFGCTQLKFFPAESSGGMNHLNSMAAPYKHLNLKFIPLGGININNARTYLESSLISGIGGSWIAKRNLIQGKDWEQITKNAKAITDLIKSIS